MAKRFNSTEIWSEDWFLEMPNDYKLFWFYMLSNCDYAGIFKVNVRSFRGLLEVEVSSKTALNYFNKEKLRIRELNETTWYIEDFFVYQYGTTFNMNNNVHASIEKIYKKYEIIVEEIRGLKEVKATPKDKDKDKDTNNTHITLHNKVKPINENKNLENGKSNVVPEIYQSQKVKEAAERFRSGKSLIK